MITILDKSLETEYNLAMTYKIPCTWQVAGTMFIEASSLEEAKNKAIENEFLPKSFYLEDTFEVDEEHYDYGKVV